MRQIENKTAVLHFKLLTLDLGLYLKLDWQGKVTRNGLYICEYIKREGVCVGDAANGSSFYSVSDHF